jgi:hypothetical protein
MHTLINKAIVLLTLLTGLFTTANGKEIDFSHITTYEALLDTFLVYLKDDQVKADCIDHMEAVLNAGVKMRSG